MYRPRKIYKTKVNWYKRCLRLDIEDTAANRLSIFIASFFSVFMAVFIVDNLVDFANRHMTHQIEKPALSALFRTTANADNKDGKA